MFPVLPIGSEAAMAGLEAALARASHSGNRPAGGV